MATYPIVKMNLNNTSIEFRDADIIEASVLQEIHPISLEMPASTAKIRIFTTDPRFSIFGDGEFYSALSRNTPVDLYEHIDGEEVLIGKFYLDQWSAPTENQIVFEIVDAIGVYANLTYNGGFWDQPTPVSDVIASLLNSAGIPYDIAENVGERLIRGWIAPSNVRDALQQACFAGRCKVSTAKSDKVMITDAALPLATAKIPYGYYGQFNYGTYDPYQGVLVSDAGIAYLNGYYDCVGIVNGKPAYYSYLNGEQGWITWTNGTWFINAINASGDEFLSTNDVATPDLVTTWIDGGGGYNADAPTVTGGAYYNQITLLSNITDADKTDSQKLTHLPMVTQISLSSHDYYHPAEGVQTAEEIYNGWLEPGDYEVPYSKPFWKVWASGVGSNPIVTSTEDGRVIVTEGSGATWPDVTIASESEVFTFYPNHVYLHVVTAGQIKIEGYPWMDNMQTIHYDEAEPAQLLIRGFYYGDEFYGDKRYSKISVLTATPNVYSVDSATMVNSANAPVVLDKLVKYYELRYRQEMKLFPTEKSLGTIQSIDSLYQKDIIGIITKMTSDLTGGFLSDTEIIGLERIG